MWQYPDTKGRRTKEFVTGPIWRQFCEALLLTRAGRQPGKAWEGVCGEVNMGRGEELCVFEFCLLNSGSTPESVGLNETQEERPLQGWSGCW